MALIKCKNCGKEISDKATNCVHCGIDTREKEKNICKECGKDIDDNTCKYCGFDNTKKEFKKKERLDDSTKTALNFVIKTVLWIFLMIIYRVVIMKGEFFDLATLGIDIVVGAVLVGIVRVIPIFKTEAYYSMMSSSSEDLSEFLDDTMMTQNGTPAERALYNQLKRNNQNNKKK